MQLKIAVGLMSGTSLDGIDAALIETDGEGHVRPIAFRYEPWSEPARATLRQAAERALLLDRPRPTPETDAAEALVTRAHILAVRKLLVDHDVTPDVIGFHGQTIAHRPDRGWTWQIGDGAAMARALGIAVVNDFRSADVAAGGQGAPLLPVYHRALAEGLERPLVILNLGGVGNITAISAQGELIAFDTGPANGLVDDWMLRHTGHGFDEGGAFAATGQVDQQVLAAMLDHPFFSMPAPKSLDRADFTIAPVAGLESADGAATLTAFTAHAVAAGLALLPERPRRLLVAGGGRHNRTMMAMLEQACGVRPEPIDLLGGNGDATEAEGFAYMAVRQLHGLPISFPGTTGAPAPLRGGVVHPA